jgi:prevent-host-death family protein
LFSLAVLGKLRFVLEGLNRTPLAKRAHNISVAELTDDPARVVRRVRSANQPLVLTHRGRPRAVLLSVEAYERSQTERAILQELARGEREIATGRGFSLDKVLADADKVLARVRK